MQKTFLFYSTCIFVDVDPVFWTALKVQQTSWNTLTFNYIYEIINKKYLNIN